MFARWCEREDRCPRPALHWPLFQCVFTVAEHLVFQYSQDLYAFHHCEPDYGNASCSNALIPERGPRRSLGFGSNLQSLSDSVIVDRRADGREHPWYINVGKACRGNKKARRSRVAAQRCALGMVCGSKSVGVEGGETLEALCGSLIWSRTTVPTIHCLTPDGKEFVRDVHVTALSAFRKNMAGDRMRLVRIPAMSYMYITPSSDTLMVADVEIVDHIPFQWWQPAEAFRSTQVTPGKSDSVQNVFQAMRYFMQRPR